MKASKEKIRIERARTCTPVSKIVEESGLAIATVNRAVNGASVSPETIGKIARALGVDVLDILDDQEGGA